MTIVVFTGPTLAASEVSARLVDAVVHGPVAQGDVFRACLQRPLAIGIIDGYFEHVPAVWHKEILWAMAQGVHVLGSSSMGALRAAELAAFGMVGVGEIFAAFASGELEDDDEVAVAHGPAEAGYRQLSVAMVDVRSTLARAQREGVISAGARATVEALAKQTFYPNRHYAELIAEARAAGCPGAELDALAAELPRLRVEQKRADAVELLDALARLRAAEPGPKQVDYQLENTQAWVRGARRLGRRAFAGDAVQRAPILDELRLEGRASYEAAHGLALQRAFAAELARVEGREPTDEALHGASRALRRAHGLIDAEAFRAWLEAEGIDEARYARLMASEATLSWATAFYGSESTPHLLDQLRLEGRYRALEARAADKRARLASAGYDDLTLHDSELDEAELLSWYFGEVLGCAVPADPHAYARDLGHPDYTDFLSIVLAERHYQRLVEGLA